MHLEIEDQISGESGGVAKDHLNAVGATFPGLPGVVTGRNDHIAWGVTNTGVDVQDLFIMEGNATHYRWNEVWLTYEIEEHSILVAGTDAPVTFTVRRSLAGPVVNDNGALHALKPPFGAHGAGGAFAVADDIGKVAPNGFALSLSWASIDPSVKDTTLEAFFGLNTAKVCFCLHALHDETPPPPNSLLCYNFPDVD